MIRAATGKPSTNQTKKKFEKRPSSANAKLQSHAYYSNQDTFRSLASLIKQPIVPSKTVSQQTVETTKPRLDRRLTVTIVDGIGEDAQRLTRINAPSSKIKIKIEERITLEQLYKIEAAFKEADTDGSGTLDIDEFKSVVKNCLNVTGHNEDPITALFMKIDSSSDGEIDWDEFCTYMQLEYAEKEDALFRSKQFQFALPAHTITSPHHKAPVFRIIFFNDTTYLCAGQDGLLTFWNAGLKLKRTKSILDEVEKQVYTSKPSVWVTDVAVLPSHGKILIATGEREFQFYELLTFEYCCVVIGLESVPLLVDVVTMEEDHGVISFSDGEGCISIITFQSLGETLKSWKKMPKVKGIPTITLHDIADGSKTTFVKWKVHNDWVTRLRYYHELRSVISSSNEPSTAIVRGCTTASTVLDHINLSSSHSANSSHTHVKSEKPRKHVTLAAQTRHATDQSVFHVYKGVKTFDFCKKTNILATGGMDRILRLWNPYVPQKPTAFLRGHNSPIIYIAIDGGDSRIFSVSVDKYVKVWDLVEQYCLVSVNPKLHKITGDITTCIYSESNKTIVFATDQLSLLKVLPKRGGEMPRGIVMRIRQAQQAGDMSVSHTEAVTCCVFNKHFNHVITCSENSVVKLWDFESGNFMFEFNKAHGDCAITAATFDTSGRRLITAGRDGAVRIWNYNNGHCLRSLERENDTSEISSVLYITMNNNKLITAVGWDHRINIFPDESDYLHHVQRPFPHWPDDIQNGHNEDIVAMAYGKPNLLATVSYEGLIIIWNVISGHSISRIPFPRECFDSDIEEKVEIVKENQSPGDYKAVNKVIFLNNRMAAKEFASLIAGCSDGSVIFWNIHTKIAHSRFITMKRSRTLSSLTASTEGDELFVANDLGYVTAWDIEDYALHEMKRPQNEAVCPRRSSPPFRICYWRAHIQPITSIELVEDHEIILTSSLDHTVRVWSSRGLFIGTFGQKHAWDVYDMKSWYHPMVPPEVLVDSQSMPDHPFINDSSNYQFRHDSETSGSDHEIDNENFLAESDNRGESELTRTISISSGRKSSSKSGDISGEAWRKKLTRRLSRNVLIPIANMHKDEEKMMLDEVRQSMCKSAGKRLRQEKLLAQQRNQQLSPDVSSRAFKSLQYHDLAYPSRQIKKPNPRAHLDDVFLIEEEEE